MLRSNSFFSTQLTQSRYLNLKQQSFPLFAVKAVKVFSRESSFRSLRVWVFSWRKPTAFFFFQPNTAFVKRSISFLKVSHRKRIFEEGLNFFFFLTCRRSEIKLVKLFFCEIVHRCLKELQVSLKTTK